MGRASVTDLERVVRDLIREELGRAQGVPPARAMATKAIANAVRAELARADKKHGDLVEVLGLSRPTIWGRLNGAYEFKRDELAKIGAFLGITAYNIIESAALGERFAGPNPNPDAEEGVLARDTWEQPPRSRARHRPAS